MIYRIAVCDDEPEQAKALEHMVSLWAEREKHAVRVELFPSAEAFLFACGESNLFDILLLDVEMRTMSGIGLAKQIRRFDKRSEIIFVTSHAEFIGEGYEVDALHYLVKPVGADRLFPVLSRAAKRLEETPPSVIIHSGGETLRLAESDILYVEARLHYLSIHTPAHEYEIREAMSVFQETLSDTFFRIHRSYLASLPRIIRICRNSVTMENGVVLPLSRGLYDAVNRAFIEHN